MLGDRVVIHPRIIPWDAESGSLDAVIASLGTVPNHCAVRITGGCAGISSDESDAVSSLFANAFNGFEGAMLIGGTRMIRSREPRDVLFGITEIGPQIRSGNPRSLVLGIIPGLEEFRFTPTTLEVMQTNSHVSFPDHTAIVHPEQDMVVAICGTISKTGVIWDDEADFCAYVTNVLRTYGHWRSVLVTYNGGETTEREVRNAAANKWPVILIRGSGRTTDELADNEEFLRKHPSVRVCEHTVSSLRHHLGVLGAIEVPTPIRHLRAV